MKEPRKCQVVETDLTVWLSYLFVLSANVLLCVICTSSVLNKFARHPDFQKEYCCVACFLYQGFAVIAQLLQFKWIKANEEARLFESPVCVRNCGIGLTTETCTSQQRNKLWKSWLKCILACTAQVQLQRVVPWPERLHASNIRSKARSSAPCVSVLACTPSGNDSS